MSDNDTINQINLCEKEEGQGEKLAVKESGAEYVTGGGEDHFRTLKNGVIMDTRTGKFINSKNQTTLTSEKIRQYKEREALARLQAASEFRRGMAKGVGVETAVKAWGRIGSAQSELALDTSKGLSSTRAAEFVGKASGFMVKDGSDQAQTGQLTITFQSEAARYLLDKLTNGIKSGDSE